MKKQILIILIICKVFNVQSQNKKKCDCGCNSSPVIDLTIKCEEKIKTNFRNEEVKKLLDNREKNLYFYKMMNIIAEPSTIGILSDFTINSDPKRQKKPYVLNGDEQIPVSLGGKWWGLNTVQVIPQIKVKILQNDAGQGDSSLPVRTPSYLPGLTYFFSFKSINKEMLKKREFYFGGFKAFHHSDGQDGNELDSSGTVNVYNGNFGENAAFEVMLGRNKEFNVFDDAPDYYSRNFYYKVGFEFHPKILTNEVFYKYQMYGRYRVNFQSGFSVLHLLQEYLNVKDTCYLVAKNQVKERWRYILNWSYIVDDVYKTGENIHHQNTESALSFKRLNINASVYWVIPGSINAALFLQAGYYGSDPYNMYFQQTVWSFRLGLAFAFFKHPNSSDLVAPTNIK